MKRIRTLILRLVAFATLTWLVVVIGLICEAARLRPTTQSADVALVLGASAPQGVPSPVFAARIDHAIDLYAAGKVRAILFTGGRGQNETLADSQAAQRYAQAKGVPAEAILTETVSHTTRENLAEAHRLLKTTSFSSCLLVSDPLHLFRAGQMMKAEGIPGHPAPTPHTRIRSLRQKLTFLGRELWFCHVYLLLGR